MRTFDSQVRGTKPQKTWRTEWRALVRETGRKSGRDAAQSVLASGGSLSAAKSAWRHAASLFRGLLERPHGRQARGSRKAQYRLNDTNAIGRHYYAKGPELNGTSNGPEPVSDNGVFSTLIGKQGRSNLDGAYHKADKAIQEIVDLLGFDPTSQAGVVSTGIVWPIAIPAVR